MHLHWERSSNTTGDCNITSLSWMGKVPEELPEEDGWKLSRNNYYQEGWLSTANVRGVVGVTYTTSFSGGGQTNDVPARTNYNLRGHRSEVTLVRWNEPYQKLASCDSTGIIFVWIKYEGRWSIELINDRNTPVKSFSWSHDGRMALICYQDGFVLVGSVAGQRYWSTMLPIDASATCGIWTPEDHQVYIGTKQGDIMVMDLHGNPVTRVELSTEIPITNLTWNCEKFNMEERDDPQGQAGETRSQSQRQNVLAVCYNNGDIDLVHGHDDVSPVHLHTGFQVMFAEWSNSGEFLAVAGRTALNSSDNAHANRIKFFRENGNPISTVIIPTYKNPVTALTWGHNDKRLFVATGNQVHIGWVNRRIGSLQLLCRLKIHKTLKNSKQVESLPLPCRVKNLISSLFTQSIKCHIPDRRNLHRFVSRPPPSGLRHYCTMIRHGDELTGPNYTIYLEHLGGFLPILKGKKTSKLKPEFVIFDPSKEGVGHFRTVSDLSAEVSDTDTETDEPSLLSPRLKRKKPRRRNQPQYFGYIGNEEVDYINNLPEDARMVEISSNIWGTKFKIHGLDLSLPPILGQISYKASLLHLQPRQMRLILTELRDDLSMANFNRNFANNFSEDEDDTDKLTMEDDLLTAVTQKEYPVVAPLPSISNRLSIVDFQKISPTRVEFADQKHVHTVPELAISFPESPDKAVASKCSANYSIQGTSTSEGPDVLCQVQRIKHQGTLGPLVAQIESLSSDLETDFQANFWSHNRTIVSSKSCGHQLAGSGDTAVSCQAALSSCQSGPVSTYLRLGRRDSVGASNSSGSSPSISSPRRWAAKAEELRDPEAEWNSGIKMDQEEAVTNSCVRSCSADHLGAIVDILGVPSDAPLLLENARRLILSAERKRAEQRRTLGKCGKSRSLDNEVESSPVPCTRTRNLASECPGASGEKSCTQCNEKDKIKDLELNQEMFHVADVEEDDIAEEEEAPLIQQSSPRTTRKLDSVRNLLEKARSKLSRSYKHSSSSDDQIGSEPGTPVHLPRRLREKLSVPESTPMSQSSPNTPLMARKLRSTKRHQSFSPVRTLFNSPLLRRKKSSFDSSEEDIQEIHHRSHDRSSRPALSGYQNLETFQKQKLRQKLRQLNSLDTELVGSKEIWSPESSPRLSPRNARISPRCGKELVMHNKAPLWNESSQVYQLDFGGRVTQESAKNFQIEYSGKQVMQFGRIDSNAYTLDFQYPFTAVQAFAVALANVTQRLK